MSLLAQLREKSASQQQVKHRLAYIISDTGNACLSVQLAIYSPQDKAFAVESATPYKIQSAHLTHPPAFLTPLDIAILSSLKQSMLENFYYSLTSVGMECFLRILETGRAFWIAGCDERRSSTRELRISLNERSLIPASFTWQIDEYAHQQLQFSESQISQWVHASDALWLIHSQNTEALSISLISDKIEDNVFAERLNSLSPPDIGEVQRTLAENDFFRDVPSPHLLEFTPLPLSEKWFIRIENATEGNLRNRYGCARIQCAYENELLCLIPNKSEHGSTLFFGSGGVFYAGKPEVMGDEQRSQHLELLRDVFEGFNREEPDEISIEHSDILHARFHSPDESRWKQFFSEDSDKLGAAGLDIVVSPTFRHRYSKITGLRIDLVKSESTLALSLNADSSQGQLDSAMLLDAIRQSISNNTDVSEFKLADGSIAYAEGDEWSAFIREFADLISEAKGHLSIKDGQVSLLARMQEVLGDAAVWQGEQNVLELSKRISQAPRTYDLQDLPLKQNVLLRDYQHSGVLWMLHLFENGVNGLLADDMGLGKTIQTLALQSYLRRKKLLQGPSLVVAPTSLIHNWRREAEEFVPHLSVAVQHGPERHEHWQQLGKCDLVITSYSCAVLDFEYWQKIDIAYLILDEAQTIKNRNTQVFKALTQFNGSYRLCLSGTPVENHLGELWSLFQFLMPGLLGSYAKYSRDFKVPVEKSSDERALERLLKRLQPFMMRRTKEEVARELPPKSENQVLIQLGDKQSSFYEELKESVKESLEKNRDDNHQDCGHLDRTEREGSMQMLLLAALTKLRQACCDPQLLDRGDVASAKTDTCVAMVESLVEDGRSVLIFSQFTSMLDILAKQFHSRGLPYLLLTGASRDRDTLVRNFQRGDAPVFLISLKAGGVGLNLTRADTVIHFDPWWNTAAEQQASDRAHRIGQDKPVFVYKLICENTIEEKVLSLQAKKSILGDRVSTKARENAKSFSETLQSLLS